MCIYIYTFIWYILWSVWRIYCINVYGFQVCEMCKNKGHNNGTDMNVASMNNTYSKIIHYRKSTLTRSIFIDNASVVNISSIDNLIRSIFSHREPLFNSLWVQYSLISQQNCVKGEVHAVICRQECHNVCKGRLCCHSFGYCIIK